MNLKFLIAILFVCVILPESEVNASTKAIKKAKVNRHQELPTLNPRIQTESLQLIDESIYEAGSEVDESDDELVIAPVKSVQTALVKPGSSFILNGELVKLCLFDSNGEEVKLDQRSLEMLNREFTNFNRFKDENRLDEARMVFNNIMKRFLKRNLSIYVNIERKDLFVLSEKFMIEDLSSRPAVIVPSSETEIETDADETAATDKDTDSNIHEDNNATWATPTKALLLLAFLMALVAVAAAIYIYQSKSEETRL